MLNLNPWPWLALIIVLGGLYGAHRYVVYNAVKQNSIQIEQRYETARLQAEATAKETTRLLKMSADKDRQDKDDKITSISVQLADAKRMLRNRPSRPSTAPSNSTITSSCTGSQLYREDGEFLIGEAARAAEIAVERDYYYNEYEKIRKALNGTGTR